MKRAKAAVAVLLFAPLLFCPRGAVPTEDPPAVEYVSIYPVQPDDPEWAALTSASEMLAACRVPAEVIDALSTPQLVEAVLDYPMRIYIILFDDYQTGLEVLEGQCDALAALMEREDAASAIVARLEQPRTRAGTSMEELTLLIIASDPRIEQQLTAEERDVVAECVEYRMAAAAAHAEKEGI